MLERDWPRTFGLIGVAQRRYKTLCVRLSIAISALQVLVGAGVAFDIRYPPVLASLLHPLGLVVFADVSRLVPHLDCAAEGDFWISLVLQVSVPAGLVVTLRLTALVASRCCVARDRGSDWDTDADGVIDREEFMMGASGAARPQFLRDGCTTLAHQLVFLLYPACAAYSVRFFVCTDEGEGEGVGGTRYLRFDMAIECGNEAWTSWLPLAAGALVVYPLGVPLFYSIVMWRNRVHLERLRRLKREEDDLEDDANKRKNTIEDLTIEEFERAAPGLLTQPLPHPTPHVCTLFSLG